MSKDKKIRGEQLQNKAEIKQLNKQKLKSESDAITKPSYIEYLKFIKKAKLPWLLYIVMTVMSLLSAKVTADLPMYSSKIVAGEINNNEVFRNFVLLSVLSILMSYLGVIQIWIDTVFAIKSQKYVYSRILRLPIKILEKYGPSSLITRLTNDSSIAGQFIGYIIGIFSAAYGILLIILNMYSTNPTLTLFLVPIMVIGILFYMFTSNFLYKANMRQVNSHASQSDYLSQRLATIKFIKSSNMEFEEMKNQRLLSEERRLASINMANFEAIRNSVSQLMEIVALIGVFGGGAVLISQNKMTMQELIEIYFFISIFPLSFEAFLNSVFLLKNMQGSTAVVMQLQDQKLEDYESGKKLEIKEGDIEFKNVSFSYGDYKVLDNISFTINKGEKTAIIGVSGCGKTTILKLLERFYEPNEGEILFSNTNIKNIKLEEWRKNLGYIIQNPMLLSGSLKSNVLYSKDENIDENFYQQVLHDSQINEFLEDLEDKDETQIGERGSNLSAGQRQRVAIARTIINQPEILLVDEGTANLDPENEVKIIKMLDKLMKNKTSIIVTHNLNTIKNADKILMIQNGKVLATGNHQTLYNNCSQYKKFIDFENKGE